jgi:hypothetical protein
MSIEFDPIRGKIAKVLSNREVVLNVGKGDNVEVGMLFDILVPKLIEIKDPDTGEILGNADNTKTKGRVRVISVAEKFSIATTFRKQRVNVGGRIEVPKLRDEPEPPRWVLRVERLNTREGSYDRLTEDERLVSTGDPVLQVLPPPDVDDLPF